MLANRRHFFAAPLTGFLAAVFAVLAPAAWAEDCEPSWDATIGQPGLGPTEGARPIAFAVFDDGNGPALYAGGLLRSAGGVETDGIARWDGQHWHPVGGGMGGGLPRVSGLAVFDDGTGEALYVGGTFTSAGGVPATHIARWDGSSWSAVGGGVSRPGSVGSPNVRAMVVYDDGTGPALFVLGDFSLAGGNPANNIAKWDGSNWSPLGSGIIGTDGVVTGNALEVFDDGSGPALYVGGKFHTAGGLTANNIARWNGLSWSVLVDVLGVRGVGDRVSTLKTFDTGSGPMLYVGGDFVLAGGSVLANGIARWSGTNWLPVGTGVSRSGGGASAVDSLAVYDDGQGPALYVGGLFDRVSGQPANRIARWSGTSWSALGAGLSASDGFGRVEALLAHDDGTGQALYVGGVFDTAGGQPAMTVARWYGCPPPPPPPPWQWDTDIGQPGMSAAVRALAVFDDGRGQALYAGGQFADAGGQTVNRIARWNGATWSPLGAGVNSFVFAMTTFDDGSGEALYLGGNFTAADGSFGGFNRVARWDGTTWTPLGQGTNGNVHSMAVFDDGNGEALYVAGSFSTAGGLPARNIARWDGSQWSPLGEGLGSAGQVLALAVYDDGRGPALYATGTFNTGSGAPGNNIARWDGSQWTPVGSGLSGVGRALAVYDDGRGPALFVGGGFTSAGGLTLNRLARWDGSAHAGALAAIVGVALSGASVALAMGLSSSTPCPPAGSGEAGVVAWDALFCNDGSDCPTPNTQAITCNGEFTIELVNIDRDGDLVTFTYEVCGTAAARNALSHWSFSLAGIDCLMDGFTMNDLLVDATLNGEAVPFVVGLDPTTGLEGLKFDQGTARNGTCDIFSLTLDESVLDPMYRLGFGCVTAATKAGNQDIRDRRRASPGYACIAGPVCELREFDFTGCTRGGWQARTLQWGGGLTTDTELGEVFMFPGFPADLAAMDMDTLLDALGYTGGGGLAGGARILLAQAVAALLNAYDTCPSAIFPYTPAQVIIMTNAALNSGDRDAMIALGARFDAANNGAGGCPTRADAAGGGCID